MTRRVLVPPLLLFQLGQPLAPAAPEPAVVVEAERAFARDAAERGTRPAFLAHMDAGSVVFEPEHVDTDSSGEMGWTTGPWECRQGGAADRPDAFGESASVLGKSGSGAWKLIVDVGIPHGRQVGSPAEPVFAPVRSVPTTVATPADVLAAERAFTDAARQEIGRAFTSTAPAACCSCAPVPPCLLVRAGLRAVGGSA